MNFETISKALNPFVQLPFSGSTKYLAVGRLALYGGLAYSMRSNKYVKYSLCGAALVCALSSMSPVVSPAIAPPSSAEPISDNTLQFQAKANA